MDSINELSYELSSYTSKKGKAPKWETKEVLVDGEKLQVSFPSEE